MGDNATYEVLRNDEEEYSLWLFGLDVPAGWHQVGKEGTRDECSAYVEAMRKRAPAQPPRADGSRPALSMTRFSYSTGSAG